MSAPPCALCGRAAHDWQSRPEGTKGHQRQDHEDRTIAYRTWHRSLPGFCILSDIDGIEWRLGKDGAPEPVAITEYTRIDGAVPIPRSYQQAIETRFNQRDMQGRLIRRTAELLKIPAFLVCFNQELTAFYIYDLTRERWSSMLSREAYTHWLLAMRNG
jgi:hypothetical protein